MITVENHPADTQDAIKKLPALATGFNTIAAGITKAPSQLNTLADISLIRLGHQCSVDRNADLLDTWKVLTTADQTISAIFTAATADEGSVDCLIDGSNYEVPSTGPTHYSNADRWQSALWLAIASRDFKRIRELCEVDEATLRAQSDDFDEFIYHWIKALQAYFRDDNEKLQAELEETSRLVAPEHVLRTPPTYLSNIFHPQFVTFLRLGGRDSDGFNRALADSLRSHRDFWTSSDAQAMNPVGQIALAPLAFACIANDSGIPVEVSSGYLPSGFVAGARTTEYQF
ncbi:immunity 49 family protein [Saccharopolyspora mangrovi]|uniref:Immunity 49 family protein n=1 Tax=Saccharopolyspora mangrovi TaxID=3082379 RepID=A0ABU6A963_9PSEU|nr:immunity 49 family protein [Saccharopolyspora sp. S2-29]MEB3367997.1 immunity 49 family protein [Saccharopolyspora sp. S2-29]